MKEKSDVKIYFRYILLIPVLMSQLACTYMVNMSDSDAGKIILGEKTLTDIVTLCTDLSVTNAMFHRLPDEKMRSIVYTCDGDLIATVPAGTVIQLNEVFSERIYSIIIPVSHWHLIGTLEHKGRVYDFRYHYSMGAVNAKEPWGPNHRIPWR